MYVPLWMKARKINNWEDDATSGTLWTSTTTFDVVVPTGKRWFVIGGQITRSDSDALTVRAYDTSDEIIFQIASQAAATGVTAWPDALGAVAVATAKPFYVLDEGEYIRIYFAGAQGATAEASCVVLEVDM